jgi:hypothetical protein
VSMPSPVAGSTSLCRERHRRQGRRARSSASQRPTHSVTTTDDQFAALDRARVGAGRQRRCALPAG